MRPSILRVLATLMLLCGATSVGATSNGPPAARTNTPALGIYPAELNCTNCHSGNALNDPNGKVEILDLPFRYEAGHSYTLRVRLTYSLADTTGASNPKWGFELTAVNPVDGKGSGTFVLPSPGAAPTYPDSLKITTVTSGSFATSGRQYIEQSTFSTRTNQPGPVEWAFDWVAPSDTTFKIRFYVSGNAANGNGSTGGDHIFTSADSTQALTNPVPGTSPATTAALLLLLASVGAGAVIVRRRTIVVDHRFR